MFVGHAPSLEGCSRQLIGEPVRTFDEFLFINRQITFLSMAQCERNTMTGKWELTPIRVNTPDDHTLAIVPQQQQQQQQQSTALSTEFAAPNSGRPNNYLQYDCQSNQIYQDPYQAFYA